MSRRSLLLAPVLFFLVAVPCCAQDTPARQLLARLATIQRHGIMYGHQDDPFYGISWQWEEGRSDTRELVGDDPAVMGFDIGGIELASACNLDSVPFARMRAAILSHHLRGGIITISWHPRNPLLGTTAWIESDTLAYACAVDSLRRLGKDNEIAALVDPKSTCAALLAKGSATHALFILWLQRVGDFLCSLCTADGTPIPFIFRPWHENNGSWFWWGTGNCSAAEYHSLWNMTQDYLRQRLPDSIVYAFSPNLHGSWTEDEYMERYPGDDRVDIIGEDAYQWGTEEAFVSALSADLTIVAQIAAAHGKLLALTECGYQNSPDATWWTRVLRPIVEQYPLVYLLPWRNWHAEHFGASKDAATAEDFKAWAQAPTFLFLHDIQDIR